MRKQDIENLITGLNERTFKKTRFKLNPSVLAEMIRDGAFGRGLTLKTLRASQVDPKRIIDFLVVREKTALNLPDVKRSRTGNYEKRYWTQRYALEERPVDSPIKSPSLGVPATQWEYLVTYETTRNVKVIARPLFEFTSFFPEELYRDFLRIDLDCGPGEPTEAVSVEDREQILLFSQRYGYRFVPYDERIARWDYFSEFRRQFRLFHECIEWVGEGLSDKGPETRVAMTRALRRIEEMCHGFTVSLDYDPGQSVVYENPDPGEHLIYLCYLVLRRKVLSMKKLM